MAHFIRNAALIQQAGSALRFEAEGHTVEVSFCTPRIARVRSIEDRSWPSYLEPRDWPGADVTVTPGEPLVASSGEMTLRIGSDPFGVGLVGAGGEVLLRQGGPTVATGGGTSTSTRPGGVSFASVTEGERSRRRIDLWLDPIGEPHFYGLGQGGQQFDRVGATRQLWNSHAGRGPGADMGIPLIVSNKGYALFFDNTCDARVTIGRSDGGFRIAYTAEDGPLDYYLLIAPAAERAAARGMLALMNEVAELLGRAPLPPKWALGFLQSTRHFADTAELERLPRLLREKRIPCDALIWLSTYGDALGWNQGVGHLGWQPTLWPNPREQVAAMRAEGFEVVTHEYPVLHLESSLFADAQQRGFLLDDGYARVTVETHPNANFMHGQRYIDFSRPEVREWWWAQHRDLLADEVGGWWLDGGEGPSSQTQLDGGDGLQLHNLYDRLRHQSFFEGESRDRPERRPVLLCRSGAAGMQRYGAGCWSGDINNTFATLEYQLPWGLNTVMSGVPYWGTDIGGFFHPIAETGELYARWFQFGAFCPLFRSHGWVWRDHVPWAHGARIEAICREYTELRYRLMPYTYTLARQALDAGLPLMRPMVLHYPDDPRVWEMGSQYLWGESLLVAPVTREGATSWPVYLPAGTWYDFWTHERYEGGRAVQVDAPLERMPLLVRGGAIVPMGPVMQHAHERPLEEVTLLVYPEGSSAFDLYEDDGRTRAYERGAHATTRITCAVAGSCVTLSVAPPEGDQSVIVPGRSYVARVRWPRPKQVAFDGATLSSRTSLDDSASGWWHDGTFLIMRLPAAAGTLTLE